MPLAPVVFRKCASLARILGQLEHSRERFTYIGKCLTLGIVDIEHPLFRPARGQSKGSALRVVEFVGNFVDDEVGEGIVLREVFQRYVASGFFAQPHEKGRAFRKQLRTETGEIQIGEIPSEAIETGSEQGCFDVGFRQK